MELKIKSSALDTLLRQHLGLYKAGNICTGRQAEATDPAPTPKDFSSSHYGLNSQYWPTFIGESGVCRRVLLHITLQPQICKLTAEEAVNQEEGGRHRLGHF